MTHSSVAALEDRAEGASSALRAAASRLSSLAAGLAVQFRVSVSHPMYHNVRLMFIEKMGLAYDFDFHQLVTSGGCWKGLEGQPMQHACCARARTTTLTSTSGSPAVRFLGANGSCGGRQKGWAGTCSKVHVATEAPYPIQSTWFKGSGTLTRWSRTVYPVPQGWRANWRMR